MPPSTGLSKVAAEGFKNAGAYDAYRPSFPAAAVDGLLGHLGVPARERRLTGSTTLQIVEIAAGTGKFTEELSRRAAAANPPWTVVAVEPHPEMRAQLAAKRLPHITVEDGHGASMPAVADGWADGVVIAQAFHWFANQDALKEIRRILKPDAVVGVIWNIEDYNKPAGWKASTQWEQALNDIVFSLRHDGHPRFRDCQWQAAFAEAAEGARPMFAPLQDDTVGFSAQLSPDALWKRVETLSQVASLPETTDATDHTEETDDDATATPTCRRTVRRRLEAATASGPDVERNAEGEVTIHGKTYFGWARRL